MMKGHVDGIKEAIPCTLLYANGRTLRTIEVSDAIVISGCLLHGRPIPSKCVQWSK
jgi:predicted metal-binding protein